MLTLKTSQMHHLTKLRPVNVKRYTIIKSSDKSEDLDDI